MRKSNKSEIKRATQLKQRIVSGGKHGIIPLGALQIVANFSAKPFCRCFYRRSRFAARFRGESAKLATMPATVT